MFFFLQFLFLLSYKARLNMENLFTSDACKEPVRAIQHTLVNFYDGVGNKLLNSFTILDYTTIFANTFS